MRKILIACLFTLGLGGCGQPVTIQSAEVAKQLGANGFEDEVRTTGISRLDTCFFWTKICPTIVKLSVGKNTNVLDFDSIYLPKSNVDIRNVKVGVQWRPRLNQKSLNTIFNEIYSDSDESSSSIRRVYVERVWKNYGERVIPAAIVDILKDMNVDQAINTSSELSHAVKENVDKVLANSPIEVTQLDIINTDVPDQVMQAKYKLFAIEDNKTRQIKELEVGIAVEQQRQALQVTRANNDKAIALKLGMTPAVYICLKTAERMADAADNKGASIYINGTCGLGGGSNEIVLPAKNMTDTKDNN